MGLFKIFLDFYDILKQDWITLKLLEPLQMLAKRAARSAASNKKSIHHVTYQEDRKFLTLPAKF